MEWLDVTVDCRDGASDQWDRGQNIDAPGLVVIGSTVGGTFGVSAAERGKLLRNGPCGVECARMGGLDGNAAHMTGGSPVVLAMGSSGIAQGMIVKDWGSIGAGGSIEQMVVLPVASGVGFPAVEGVSIAKVGSTVRSPVLIRFSTMMGDNPCTVESS